MGRFKLVPLALAAQNFMYSHKSQIVIRQRVEHIIVHLRTYVQRYLVTSSDVHARVHNTSPTTTLRIFSQKTILK